MIINERSPLDMIDYSKIKDPEYFKSLLDDINQITDIRVITNILKILSIKISNQEIDPIDASLLLATTKNRYKVLTNSSKQRQYENEMAERKWAKENGYEQNGFPTSNYPADWNGEGGTTKGTNANNQDKKLSLSPTSVSSRRGMVSLIILVASIAATTALYTLLYIAHITK